jgi:hemerythrin HHE cation binding domain-containing protein
MKTLETLLSAQRALRTRFDDFFRAMQRENRTAMEIAIVDFEQHLRRWTEAEEKALIPALERAGIAGRDPRRELRLEYVQIRELTHFIVLQLTEGIRSGELAGYAENLNRRLRAHESEMAKVYYPAAAPLLNEEEWAILEAARPEE